jgi:hypothetical protein
MAHFANDRRYRRAQSGYLVLLLLLTVATWPTLREQGSGDEQALILFLIEWLIPAAFSLAQLRLGFGLGEGAESMTSEHLPIPRAPAQTLAVVSAEQLHCLSLWAMQAPLVIAAVSAAGLTAGEAVHYLLWLLALGAGARLLGLVARRLLRAHWRSAEEERLPQLRSVLHSDGSPKRYPRSSSTVSR